MRNSSKKIGWTGVILLALMISLALFGPYLVPFEADETSGMPFEAPNSGHWLGTNDMGQDILAELVEGARTSLFIGITTALLATIIGAVIGVLSGYIGGWFDTLSMCLVDITLTLPFLPLMIVIAVYLGPGIFTQVFVITLVMWAGKARQIRAQTLSLRSRGPVLAAKTMGAGNVYIFRKHIFPGVFPIIIPQFVGAMNAAIMMESSLSFLGMGDPLTKSWGSILYYANSRSAFLTEAWMWWIIPPGICIVLTVLSFSFIGYYLEEKINPRLSAYQPATVRKKEKSSGEIIEPASSILEVQDLVVNYSKGEGMVRAVNHVDLSVRRGEVVGLVGESGSGKTTVVSAIMQQLKTPAVVEKGSIFFNGQDMSRLSSEELRQLRGNKIALISQAAMNALNPVIPIGKQLGEAVLSHYKVDKKSVQRRVEEILEQVGLDAKWGRAFPHELSGGMRQRVIIAMALMNEPDLIIADEPTTGLDVKVQVEIIQLLRELQHRLNVSMIFISHDLPVVLTLTDRLVIMKHGNIVDQGPSVELAKTSDHPYTRRLIDSIPRIQKTSSAVVKQS
ncbi:dipeptide/oligopeptide/nickel ABC transporter permease/ATP-binding protein [Peribacillus asahii]|uniref:dipeptide/oligopeptide/nickel ABC transporter permease/ATP-binding protein n=1 Tax=Peribacillus asahii TaxID=228899 RepID=UPI00207B05E4|nr:dipeptide/oligopeptide/nickel ABC transporter permease/ATP-binding protein [Peribacillus asahii]USK70262.1 dipeptide/oligopeptide/nickel ABC transporter permease/ATP-binding protein [Peribacillus asahii]